MRVVVALALVALLSSHALARAQPMPPVPPFPPPPPGVEVVVATPQPPTTLGVGVPPEAGPPVVIVQSPSVSVSASATYEDPVSVPLRIAVEAGLGWSMMDPAVDSHTAGLGLSLELDALEWLAFGVHGHASFRSVLAPDTDLDGLADRPAAPVTALTLTAGPRFRIFTADESRDHVGLELGAGLLWIPEQSRPWGAVLDVALFGGIDERERGGSSGSDGFVLSPLVRYQQGLADAGSYRAVLVGLGAGFDFGTSPRRGSAGRSGAHYTLGLDLGLGGGFLRQGTIHEGFVADLGLRMGVVLGEVFEPTVRFDFMHRVAGVDREGLDAYGVAGGFRVLFDPWAPLYLEALAGWAVRAGTPASQVTGGVFLDAGAGLRWLDCGGTNVAVIVGARARVGLLDSDALTSLTGVLGFELDGGPRPDRPRCRVEIPAGPTIEAPPPPTVYVPVTPEPEPAPVPMPAPTHGVVPAPAPMPTSSPTPASEPSGPSRTPLSLEPMALFGLADSDRRMDGLVAGFGLVLGAAPIDELVLQLRFVGLSGADEARVLGAPAIDAEETAPFSAYLLGGAVRFRVFTDAHERSGWTFDLGGGYLTLDGAPEAGRRAGWQHGGYAEAGIGHQRGVRFDDGFSFQFGLALRYQQGLGELFDYRAVLLTGSIALEADTPHAADGRRNADFAYTLGLRARGGLSFYRFSETGPSGTGGLSLHFGIPIGRWIEPRARVDLHFVGNDVERSSSPLLSFLGALRLRLDEVFPMFLEAAGGYSLHYDVAGQRSPGTSVVEVGIGARISDCSGSSDGALEVGVHLRLGVEGARTDDALVLSIGYEYAGGAPMFARGERAHCQWAAARATEEPYEPPPPRTSPQITPPPDVLVPIPPDVYVPGPPGPPVIEVTPPTPPDVVIQPPAPRSRTGAVVVQPGADRTGAVVVQPDADPRVIVTPRP